MSKEPFLMLFRQPVPTVDPDLVEEDYSYSPQEQLNVTAAGQLLWRSTKTRTSYATSSRYIPSHRTPKGKFVPGHYTKCRQDRRIGK